LGKYREVLENAAAKTNLVHAVPLAKLATNRIYHKRDGIVKATRNIVRNPSIAMRERRESGG